MEVEAWKRNDKLVSMLTSLSGHIQNGRGKEAIAVVKTIKKDGAQFREAVKTMTDCVNILFEQKTREMETMQKKRDEMADKIPSLKSGISTCEVKIVQHQNDMEASRRREGQADDKYREADRDWDAGNKMTGLRWYHIAIPIVGQVVGICENVSGANQMQRAEERMSDARRDKERAQQALREAKDMKQTEETKLGIIKNLVGESQTLVDELHAEVGVLKDATAFTFELNGVLQEVLVVTDSAIGRTDRLKTMLDRFMETTGVVESRGTRTLLRTVGERWMDVRDLVVTIPGDRNALIYQEAQRMTALSLGRQALKDSDHLLTSLKMNVRDGRTQRASSTLMEMQVIGESFESLLRVQIEQLQEKEKRTRNEIRRTEKRLNIEQRLSSIGFENNLTELSREHQQQQESLNELIKQRKSLERCVEPAERLRSEMGSLRSRLKRVRGLVPGLVRAFRSDALLHHARGIEDEWGVLSTG